jgi:hypothetical protein
MSGQPDKHNLIIMRSLHAKRTHKMAKLAPTDHVGGLNNNESVCFQFGNSNCRNQLSA